MFKDGYISDTNDLAIFQRKDTLSGYTERMKDLHRRIDTWGADISISLHFNASSKTYVNGHEILYCSKSGKAIAKKLDVKLDQYLNNNHRNLKKVTQKQRGGGFLCHGKSVCILAEPFFASHQHKYVKYGEERENLLTAIAEFIDEL